MAVFLDGVAARFYRGIGHETQFIGPFSRLNLFIGANNSGKSIVLNLLASQVGGRGAPTARRMLDGPETYRGRKSGEFAVAVGRRSEKVLEDLLSRNNHPFRSSNGSSTITLEVELRNILAGLERSGLVWASLSTSSQQLGIFTDPSEEDGKAWTREWQAVWSSLTGHGRGAYQQHWFPDTIRLIAGSAIPSLPTIHLVPAKRELGGKNEPFEDLSGKGLIDHLAKLQNPSWDRQSDREKFQKINKFVQDVTGKLDAELEVPNGREHLLVHMDNKVLPLSSLGTGVHEVVLIAAFCTIHDGDIMCIEEPEIHLHPLLQRKLIRYLVDQTRSQYFIATHSSAFIDAPEASVFRVTNDGEQTRIRGVMTKHEQRDILDDLGCLASDILQSNAVIWVEGPSDRAYLKHWLAAVDPELEEGIHYTIMFYGGALVRHLSASDETLTEFIKLRDLNRNMAIILDSDRDSAESPLKRHVRRIIDEMADETGLVWVTAGREIENYIDGKRLQAALKQRHPNLYQREGKIGRFDHSFHFFRDNPDKSGALITYKEADKVGVANLICSEKANLDVLDLRTRLNQVVDLVRRANGMAASNAVR